MEASTANEMAKIEKSFPVSTFFTRVFATSASDCDSSSACNTASGLPPFTTSCTVTTARATFAALCQSTSDSRTSVPNKGPVCRASGNSPFLSTKARSSMPVCDAGRGMAESEVVKRSAAFAGTNSRHGDSPCAKRTLCTGIRPCGVFSWSITFILEPNGRQYRAIILPRLSVIFGEQPSSEPSETRLR